MERVGKSLQVMILLMSTAMQKHGDGKKVMHFAQASQSVS